MSNGQMFGEYYAPPVNKATRLKRLASSVAFRAILLMGQLAAVVAVVIGPIWADDSYPKVITKAISFYAVELPPAPPPVAPPRTAAQPPKVANPGIPPFEPPDGIPPEVPTFNPGPTGPPDTVPGGDDRPNFEPTPPPPPPPTPPAPEPKIPIRVDRSPQKTLHVAPKYPAIAQSARVQGVVIIEAIVDIDGRVRDARVLRSIPLLDTAAVEAVLQWRFTPTLVNGQLTPVILTVTVNFSLQ